MANEEAALTAEDTEAQAAMEDMQEGELEPKFRLGLQTAYLFFQLFKSIGHLSQICSNLVRMNE